MSKGPLGFGPASRSEAVVFGAQRPGYPGTSVGRSEVDEWIRFMQDQGIKRVVCLLPQGQLRYYSSLPGGLLGLYKEAFGEERMHAADIEDYHLCELVKLKKVLSFLSEADAKREKVIVHCSGGLGRTGHVLAAWLVHGRGFDPGAALNAVIAMGRDPKEAIRAGHATEAELLRLASCHAKR